MVNTIQLKSKTDYTGDEQSAISVLNGLNLKPGEPAVISYKDIDGNNKTFFALGSDNPNKPSLFYDKDKIDGNYIINGDNTPYKDVQILIYGDETNTKESNFNVEGRGIYLTTYDPSSNDNGLLVESGGIISLYNYNGQDIKIDSSGLGKSNIINNTNGKLYYTHNGGYPTADDEVATKGNLSGYVKNGDYPITNDKVTIMSIDAVTIDTQGGMSVISPSSPFYYLKQYTENPTADEEVAIKGDLNGFIINGDNGQSVSIYSDSDIKLSNREGAGDSQNIILEPKNKLYYGSINDANEIVRKGDLEGYMQKITTTPTTTATSIYCKDSDGLVKEISINDLKTLLGI